MVIVNITGKFYAGVGSRRAPGDVIQRLMKIGNYLSRKQYTLRSGGANGSDKAFELNANHKQIFYANDANEEAIKIALDTMSRDHIFRLTDYAKKLHGRNAFQILGPDLKTPVEFVICWTPDGCEHHNNRSYNTGGTGTAISIASLNNIPVFNLKNGNDKAREYFEKNNI